MPVESLLDDPRALALPPAAYGMLCRLVHHYWQTDCAPMPVNADDLQAIARAHVRTWIQYRDEIRAILADLLPDMARRRDARDAKLDALVNATRARRALAKADRLRDPAKAQVSAPTRQKRAESRVAALESIAPESVKRFAD